MKPNICVERGYETGAITDPALVQSIAEYIEEKGSNPIIAEAPIVGKDAKKVFKETGYDRVREEFDLINLNENEFVSKSIPNDLEEKISELDFLGQGCRYEEIEISKKALEADQIVSIPSMKTHALTKVTLSLKNMKGVLDQAGKKAFHRKGLAQGVAALNYFVKPDLSIVDGVIGQEGLGPINGDPKEARTLIIGKDPVEVDYITSNFMDISPDKSGLLKACKEILGKGESKIRNFYKKPFKKVSEDKEFEKVEIRSENACSGCTNALISVLSRLKSEEELDEMIKKYDGLVFHKGSGTEIKGEGFEIGVGNCTKGLDEKEGVDLWLPGCPPIGRLAEDTLRHELLEKEPLNSSKSEIKEFKTN